MPRKVAQEVKDRPAYLTENGEVNLSAIFKHQPKQTELLRKVMRGGKVYIQPAARQCLSTGGIRSGKTSGWLMFFVMHYCLAFKNCNMLVLRRTFRDLESGAISDFKAFMPKELYEYDQTKHTATLTNGSRIVFGHCNNLREKDIQQYLGSAYPAILVDECGQFSPDAWMMLSARNIVNAACEPDEHGNLPIPAIVGCTNPLGPYYSYYQTLFVLREPWNKPEEARKDEKNGTWWIQEAGEWRCIYNPDDYAYQRTTVLDNPELLARDPGIIARLDSLPKAKREKMLLGLDGPSDGQYFDCFTEDNHVVNLREDPEAIIWQEYQGVWLGSDWGMSHANATYFFTKALVRYAETSDYKLKTVCFAEVVTTGGKTYRELASLLAAKCKLPNGSVFKPKAIYFSHEKFARQMDSRSPADEYSRELRTYGLPSVTPATRDRIGSASLMYNAFRNGELVILDHCKEIIQAIPTLQRDPDEIDDCLKTDAKGDDCYDAFRYGLYGYLATKKKPLETDINEHAQELAKTDPLAAHFFLLKKAAEQANRTVSFKPPELPVWQSRMQREMQ